LKISISHFKNFSPIIAFLIFGSGAVFLWQSQNRHEQELVLRHTETSSEQIRIRVQGLMNARMASLEILADRWVERTPPDFSRKRFLEFAENFYTHYPGFTGINWIDSGGVVRWVFPSESNERVIDNMVYERLDLQVRDTFQKSGEHLKYMATPCAELIQGGLGFHTFRPLVYSGRVQGYLNGVFQIKRVMETCLAKNILTDFWIRIYEADQQIYTNEEQSHSNPEKPNLHVLRAIHFPGKTWQLEVFPKAALYPPKVVRNPGLLAFGIFISAILSLLLHFLNYRMQMFRQARDHALHEVSERKRAELHIRNLSQQLINAQENERQMISYELHDRVAQDLSFSKIECDMLLKNQPELESHVKEKLVAISNSLQGAIRTVRDISYDLRPPVLADMGIAEALKIYCEEFSIKNGVGIDFQSAGLPSFNLNSNVEIHLYRLVQEGLNNIRKHANAARVNIMLMGASPNIILTIYDNGQGFDVKTRELALGNEKRMGLRSMEERVNLLGGQITINSRPMQGTKILIKIPFKR
jgi:signal transduction histidine kinase